MLVFKNEEEKEKNHEQPKTFEGVSVTEALEVERKWKERAKIANDQKPADSKYVYKVRESPKNGWGQKKFLKQRTGIRH